MEKKTLVKELYKLANNEYTKLADIDTTKLTTLLRPWILKLMETDNEHSVGVRLLGPTNDCYNFTHDKDERYYLLDFNYCDSGAADSSFPHFSTSIVPEYFVYFDFEIVKRGINYFLNMSIYYMSTGYYHTLEVCRNSIVDLILLIEESESNTKVRAKRVPKELRLYKDCYRLESYINSYTLGKSDKAIDAAMEQALSNYLVNGNTINAKKIVNKSTCELDKDYTMLYNPDNGKYGDLACVISSKSDTKRVLLGIDVKVRFRYYTVDNNGKISNNLILASKKGFLCLEIINSDVDSTDNVDTYILDKKDAYEILKEVNNKLYQLFELTTLVYNYGRFD